MSASDDTRRESGSKSARLDTNEYVFKRKLPRKRW